MPAPATPQPCLCHRAPVLLLLLPALAAALACTDLRTQQSAFNGDSLQLLRTMAPKRTLLCHQHHANFSFPDTLLADGDPQQATATILRILRHLWNTLNNESIPDHWDRHAHQQLLNKLDHQIQQLQECLTDSTVLSKGQGPRNSRLTINTYFRRIRHFLRTHSHSSCAWDIVRLQLHTCFQHIDKLTRRIQ
ncbi:IFN protein, partial [Nothocercus julius]|nr:IFN protein [Nothocercus julius]